MSQVMDRLRTVDRELAVRLTERHESFTYDLYGNVERREKTVRTTTNMSNGDPPDLMLWGAEDAVT